MAITDLEIASCKALGRAVLMDALEGLERKRHQKRGWRDRTEIVVWFKSDARDTIFSFVPLCEWLGLDAGRVRKQLKLKGKM